MVFADGRCRRCKDGQRVFASVKSACSVSSLTSDSGLGIRLLGPLGVSCNSISVVKKRLRPELTGDRASFGHQRQGAGPVVDPGEVLSVVEQTLGEVVGAGRLPQRENRSIKCHGDVGIVPDVGDPGLGEKTLGAQQRWKVPDRVGVEKRNELYHGIDGAEVVGDTGCQWPRPPDEGEPDAKDRGVGQDGAGVLQAVGVPVLRCREEGITEGGTRLILQVLTATKPRQFGIGGGVGEITTQCGQN